MVEDTAEPREDCGAICEAAISIEALNRTCYCLNLDHDALRRGLETDLNTQGLSGAMIETHPHLFAAVPMFVSPEYVEGMARVIDAIEAVVATPHFRRVAHTVLARAHRPCCGDATGFAMAPPLRRVLACIELLGRNASTGRFKRRRH